MFERISPSFEVTQLPLYVPYVPVWNSLIDNVKILFILCSYFPHHYTLYLFIDLRQYIEMLLDTTI